MKNTVSMPAVPAPRGRMAALTADRTPSMARALELMPPSAISEITTHRTITRRTPKMRGGA